MLLTIDRALNAIWRVRIARPIAQRVLVYWAAATLGPLLLGVSLSVTTLAISGPRGIGGALPGGVSVLLNVRRVRAVRRRHGGAVPLRAEHVRALAACAGRRRCSSRPASRWRSGCSAGTWRRCRRYAMVYGAFATVPIFLVWIYCGWVIVLLGAVIAAYAPSLQMSVVRRPATPGHRFTLALTLLAELARARVGRPGRRQQRAARRDAAHRPAADRAGARHAGRARLGRPARRRRRAALRAAGRSGRRPWPRR